MPVTSSNAPSALVTFDVTVAKVFTTGALRSLFIDGWEPAWPLLETICKSELAYAGQGILIIRVHQDIECNGNANLEMLSTVVGLN